MINALINLFLSVMLSVLISFSTSFTFLVVQPQSKFISTFLNPFTSLIQTIPSNSLNHCLFVLTCSLYILKAPSNITMQKHSKNPDSCFRHLLLIIAITGNISLPIILDPFILFRCHKFIFSILLRRPFPISWLAQNNIA